MFGCCGHIFLLSWPFFPTHCKWTSFSSGRYFRGPIFRGPFFRIRTVLRYHRASFSNDARLAARHLFMVNFT